MTKKQKKNTPPGWAEATYEPLKPIASTATDYISKYYSASEAKYATNEELYKQYMEDKYKDPYSSYSYSTHSYTSIAYPQSNYYVNPNSYSYVKNYFKPATPLISTGPKGTVVSCTLETLQNANITVAIQDLGVSVSLVDILKKYLDSHKATNPERPAGNYTITLEIQAEDEIVALKKSKALAAILKSNGFGYSSVTTTSISSPELEASPL